MDKNECVQSDAERELWAREFENFIPGKVFDAHVHIWDDLLATHSTEESGLRVNADGKKLHEYYAEFFPNRDVSFQFVATPLMKIDFDAERKWFLKQCADNPQDCGALLVTPQMAPGDIEEAVRNNPGIIALKPYFCFAESHWQASLLEYLPEAFIEIANAYSLNVVLHLSKPLKCADEKNLEDLKYVTLTYPNVEWQLAHCACGFNGALLERAIGKLAEVEHIFYDTSAVCDQYAFELLMKYEDPSRVLFGTDLLPGSAGRGRFNPYALGWFFHAGGNYPWCEGSSIRLVYEEVLALERACSMLDVPRSKSDAMFFGNHIRYLNRRNRGNYK